ncbi:MAG TPA: hypothetical protein VH595_04450 [Verrucomicrobiae bacterium]|jgi:hypothetical protein|nr:hypothetical protein [Verrucomicrobiae bacterium]
MNALNSKVQCRLRLYEVADLRHQLEKLDAPLSDAWPVETSSPSFGARQTLLRDDARVFAQFFGSNATRARAIELLEQDPASVAAFLYVANEFLSDTRFGKSVSFDIEESQEKAEFGPLCAFVLFQIAQVSCTNPILYRQPLFV